MVLRHLSWFCLDFKVISSSVLFPFEDEHNSNQRIKLSWTTRGSHGSPHTGAPQQHQQTSNVASKFLPKHSSPEYNAGEIHIKHKNRHRGEKTQHAHLHQNHRKEKRTRARRSQHRDNPRRRRFITLIVFYTLLSFNELATTPKHYLTCTKITGPTQEQADPLSATPP